jgi:NTP pyrophosphatase (non-canonical NTP hydrolase)
MTTSEFTESTLKPRLRELEFNQLVMFTEDLAEEIRVHAAQGASDQEWMDAQAMCVAEEAGEFIKAYRKWRGFARTAGSVNDVHEELADVIIASLLMFSVMNYDAQRHIKDKLYQVITRGYVNKPG